MLDFASRLESNHVGLEPYPLSLRLNKWIKWMSLHNISDQKLSESIFQQTHLLRKNIEYHLLGNHVLENGFALLFAGYFLGDESIIDQATRIVEKELRRQILPDGGHAELSPMYHSLMLYRTLDCINLMQSNQADNDELLSLLKTRAGAMLSWNKEISFSENHLPDVNDSTPNIAPKASELFSYAERLKIKYKRIPLAESGYRKIITPSFQLFIDVGPIGLEYQPGHAHADTFNCILYTTERTYISNSSTSTYEEGEIRNYERGTSAHNTVLVSNENSSDVWKSFRVGRRARVVKLEETSNRITACHNGYKHLGIYHNRTFEWNDSEITIMDELVGNKLKAAKAYFHFPSGIQLSSGINSYDTQDTMLSIAFEGNNSIKLLPYFQGVGFNKRKEAIKIEVPFNTKLITRITITTK